MSFNNFSLWCLEPDRQCCQSSCRRRGGRGVRIPVAVPGRPVQRQEEGELHGHHLLPPLAGDLRHLCPGEQPQSSGVGRVRWSGGLQSHSLGVCADQASQEHPDPSSCPARSTPGQPGPRSSGDP